MTRCDTGRGARVGSTASLARERQPLRLVTAAVAVFGGPRPVIWQRHHVHADCDVSLDDPVTGSVPAVFIERPADVEHHQRHSDPRWLPLHDW